MIPLSHLVALSAVLFSVGVYGALARRNVLGVLMSLELIFNAANINLVAFARAAGPGNPTGHVFVIFVITIAAAEAVVGLALVLALYRNLASVYTERMNLLKG